jgi:anti-sigma regulatory factor (Ser/Thr protein kinase)
VIERYFRRFPNSYRSVVEARCALVTFARRAGFEGEALTDLECAVGEALANAAEHGFRDGTTFDVRAFVDGNELVIEVCDRGPGFPHEATTERDPPATGSPRGFGVYIMRRLVDAIEYGDRGRRVRLTKRLPAAAAADDELSASG